MLKRHEIKVLLNAGHSQTEVARLAGVSLRSVKRITKEEAVTHVDDHARRRECGIGRPNVVGNFRKSVVAILEKEPGLKSVEILRRMRLEGCSGGKTALYSLVASVRPKGIKPLVRFEGLPGEFSQHDFGPVRHRISRIWQLPVRQRAFCRLNTVQWKIGCVYTRIRLPGSVRCFSLPRWRRRISLRIRCRFDSWSLLEALGVGPTARRTCFPAMSRTFPGVST